MIASPSVVLTRFISKAHLLNCLLYLFTLLKRLSAFSPRRFCDWGRSHYLRRFEIIPFLHSAHDFLEFCYCIQNCNQSFLRLQSCEFCGRKRSMVRRKAGEVNPFWKPAGCWTTYKIPCISRGRWRPRRDLFYFSSRK
jgi:hypothetical protein